MKKLPKNQLITQPKAILLVTAVMVAIFFALVPSADAQETLAIPCERTRLGCLDENPPIVPIDQPVLIQVGLQVNIKCEAKSVEGQAFVLDLNLVKNVQVLEGHVLDYYLVAGKHGTLNFKIDEAGAPEVQHYVMGEFVFHSEIENSADEKNVLIKSSTHRATRVGNIVTTTTLAFSNSAPGQPLKILSATQETTQNSFFNKEPSVSTKNLTFNDSNCVYY